MELSQLSFHCCCITMYNNDACDEYISLILEREPPVWMIPGLRCVCVWDSGT